MVAVAHDMRVRPGHLRLVGDDELALRRRRDLVMLRRRLVAVALLVVALVGMGLALSRAATVRAGAVVDGAGAGASVAGGSGGSAGSAAMLPIARAEYVVQPGDTLWKIARALQPEGDVRPLVYQLGEARDGAPLRVGERITLP